MLRVCIGDSGSKGLVHPEAEGCVVALGGTVTRGKLIDRPFPDLVQEVAGCPVVNLGAANAGPDHYLATPGLLRSLGRARLVMIELAGADGVTNPFYTVHSRRNDRFLAPTPALRDLFPTVDFAEIHFTRHLLSVLRHSDPAGFAKVAQVLRATWLTRMQALLRHLPPRRIFLHLSREGATGDPLSPALIDRHLTASLEGPVSPVVTVTLASIPRASGPVLPDAADHCRIAQQLAPQLRRLLNGAPRLLLRPADRVT